MTETLARPASAGPASAAVPARSLPAAAAGAALGAAGRGLLLLTALAWLLWLAEDRSGSDLVDVGRSGGQLWLAAHGTWLDLPAGRLGLTPLGLALLPLLLCRRVGRSLAEARPGSVSWRVGLAVAVPYAALAVALALVTSSQALRPVPVSAGLGALLVAWLGAGLGARTPAARPVPASARLSEHLRRALVAGLAAGGVLLAGAALLAAITLALDAGTATELAESTEPGAVGGLGLLLVGAALVPNAVVCAAAWLAGPGFAVGAGTSTTPFATDLGPVPPLPLLAALPGGQPPSWAVLALVVPVLAGAAGGCLLHRRRAPGSAALACREAALTGVVTGAGLAVLAVLAAGPLGGEHLTAVGPSAWRTGLAVAAEVALGAGLALLVLRWWRARSAS